MTVVVEKDTLLKHIESNSFYKQEKIEALNQLYTFTLPDSREESWRKMNLKVIPFQDFHFTDSKLDTHIDTKYVLNNINSKEIDEIIKINYNKEIAQKFHYDVDYFSIMNFVFMQNLNIISVPKDMKEKIKIHHKAISGDGFFPFTVIIANEGSQVEIIEEVMGIEKQVLWNSTLYLIAKRNSHVQFTSIRKHSDYEFHFHKIRILQYRDSNVHTGVFHTGGLSGKGFVQTRLLEEHIQYRGIGFFFGEKGHFHNMEMDVVHLNNYEESSLMYKTIVKDRAHSVFIGKLETPFNVRGVKSHQSNHNLILSKKAKSESMPWLIVRSEDVSCEHGATAGDLDEEAIFYLKTRGFTENEAKKILMTGFIYDLIQETSLDEEEKEKYLEFLSSKL